MPTRTSDRRIPKQAVKILKYTCNHTYRKKVPVARTSLNNYQQYLDWKNNLFAAEAQQPCPNCRAETQIQKYGHLDDAANLFTAWEPDLSSSVKLLCLEKYFHAKTKVASQAGTRFGEHLEGVFGVIMKRALADLGLSPGLERERAIVQDLLSERWEQIVTRKDHRYWFAPKNGSTAWQVDIGIAVSKRFVAAAALSLLTAGAAQTPDAERTRRQHFNFFCDTRISEEEIGTLIDMDFEERRQKVDEMVFLHKMVS